MKLELDLSNYETKEDLKNNTDVYTSVFAKKVDLANLKSETDKLDIDELKTTPVGLSKLSDVVKMKLLKKLNMMNWFKKLMLLRLLILII